MQRVKFETGGRYPVLRSIAIIYVFLGGIAIVGGVVGVLWSLLRAPFPATDRIILAGAALVVATFWCALMLGGAEIIKLFVDIEHNTRMTSLDRLMPSSDGGGKPSGAAPINRMSCLEEEAAEVALIRGH
jgi:hypothetical protein